MLSTHNLAGQAHNGCLLEIAHRRVYHASTFTSRAVGSYPTISPLPTEVGGFLSVALSVPQVPFLESESPSVTRSDCPLVSGLSSPFSPGGGKKAIARPESVSLESPVRSRL